LSTPVHHSNVRSQPDGIREVPESDFAEVARIVTDALLDDPGWQAVGPDNRNRRRRVLLPYHRAVVAVTDGHGGPIYGAYRDGGLAAVAVTFAAGRHPPPAYTFARYVPPFLRAGPATIARALRASATQDKGHPDEPHHFVWQLAVDPPHQRSGLGRALLAHTGDHAEAPLYLDTANPANVPYYASCGFEEIGSAALPRGATMWFMRRP
jgi:GNAT superfamily N-acetyltransferase